DAAVAFVKDLSVLGQVDVAAAYISSTLDQVTVEDARLDFQRDVWDRLHAILGDAPALSGMPVKIHVRGAQGHPAHELLLLAKEQRNGLIVIGTHRRSAWRQMLKASFPNTIAVHAETNVLCVPGTFHAPTAQVPAIHRALVATDFSDCGNDAIRHAYSLVGPGGEVRLLHVCFSPSPGFDMAIASEAFLDHTVAMAQSLKDADARLTALIPRVLATTGVTTTAEILPHHDIAAGICEAADRFGADVICMGTTGHSRARIALLGSTVQAVLAHSHRPVFVVTLPQA
ncbi:MAG: universal stress protein, partial [Prosthecobacter sp.]|nr:universal stress protein [Prosthecobacter sp.]